ncbi:MAG: hypothetical protein IKM97_01525 [Clostridia bacterium]|nr:hypothetical protein [Clostridia bacterium]
MGNNNNENELREIDKKVLSKLKNGFTMFKTALELDISPSKVKSILHKILIPNGYITLKEIEKEDPTESREIMKEYRETEGYKNYYTDFGFWYHQGWVAKDIKDFLGIESNFLVFVLNKDYSNTIKRNIRNKAINDKYQRDLSLLEKLLKSGYDSKADIELLLSKGDVESINQILEMELSGRGFSKQEISKMPYCKYFTIKEIYKMYDILLKENRINETEITRRVRGAEKTYTGKYDEFVKRCLLEGELTYQQITKALGLELNGQKSKDFVMNIRKRLERDNPTLKKEIDEARKRIKKEARLEEAAERKRAEEEEARIAKARREEAAERKRAEAERKREEAERKRAEAERKRAEAERKREEAEAARIAKKSKTKRNKWGTVRGREEEIKREHRRAGQNIKVNIDTPLNNLKKGTTRTDNDNNNPQPNFNFIFQNQPIDGGKIDLKKDINQYLKTRFLYLKKNCRLYPESTISDVFFQEMNLIIYGMDKIEIYNLVEDDLNFIIEIYGKNKNKINENVIKFVIKQYINKLYKGNVSGFTNFILPQKILPFLKDTEYKKWLDDFTKSLESKGYSLDGPVHEKERNDFINEKLNFALLLRGQVTPFRKLGNGDNTDLKRIEAEAEEEEEEKRKER